MRQAPHKCWGEARLTISKSCTSYMCMGGKRLKVFSSQIVLMHASYCAILKSATHFFFNRVNDSKLRASSLFTYTLFGVIVSNQSCPFSGSISLFHARVIASNRLTSLPSFKNFLNFGYNSSYQVIDPSLHLAHPVLTTWPLLGDKKGGVMGSCLCEAWIEVDCGEKGRLARLRASKCGVYMSSYMSANHYQCNNF